MPYKYVPPEPAFFVRRPDGQPVTIFHAYKNGEDVRLCFHYSTSEAEDDTFDVRHIAQDLGPWWADNESENGTYGVYPCREDGDHASALATVDSAEKAARLVAEHNGRTNEGTTLWAQCVVQAGLRAGLVQIDDNGVVSL